ncbi:MAG: EAL domain-containing protein [Firmicutes bacterium]|nr:EAL domain-containing protein [Alicyclobacillaceae bacterium]MCL6496315.1 EAL domain-containing protein [Bacillota bacterium]
MDQERGAGAEVSGDEAARPQGLEWTARDRILLHRVDWAVVAEDLARGQARAALPDGLVEYVRALDPEAGGRPWVGPPLDPVDPVQALARWCTVLPQLLAAARRRGATPVELVAAVKRAALDWVGGLERACAAEIPGAPLHASRRLARAVAQRQPAVLMILEVAAEALSGEEAARRLLAAAEPARATGWSVSLEEGRVAAVFVGAWDGRTLLHAFRRWRRLAQSLGLTLRVGVARFPHDGNSVEAVWHQAQWALARHGRRGAPRDLAAPWWVRELLAPEGVQGIRAYFQPIIHLPTGEVQGFEALARYVDPQGQVHLPGEFLPWLDREGRLAQLDQVVLWQAVAAVAEWRRRGWPGYVAVNVAPIDLDRADWAHRLLSLLAGYPFLHAAAIHLEILESAALTDIERTREVMGRLAQIGFQWSLDDFGTGYSSLAHVHYLPIHAVKVDRSFLSDWDSPTARAIIQAIIGMARPLGVTVVAEGVERPAQVEALLEWGCHAGQGFLFGPALPPEVVWEWLEGTWSDEGARRDRRLPYRSDGSEGPENRQ